MWLSDLRIVQHDRVIERGAVRIDNGMIAEIREEPVAGGIAGDGLALMPGFIDMHGDMIERELEPRPRVNMPAEIAFRELDRRLAGAGVVTAYAAVSFTTGAAAGEMRSFEHTGQVIRDLCAVRDKLNVDHRIHARFDITLDNALSVIRGLIEDDTLDLVSLMDHTPGQGQYRDIERHIEHVAHMRGISRTEAQALVERKIADRTRPEDVLTATLREISDLCKAHKVIMASHDDDTVEKVALMNAFGVAISEFPVDMIAAKEAHACGLANAMGAPNALRGQSYSGNLSARQAHEAGVLDILASDYHPSSILPAILILAQTDPNGLPGAVRLATANPAKALGLTDRGRIEVGQKADLVIAETDGMGHIVTSMRNGRVIYSDGVVGLNKAA
jgi:alpha-D-ribose 1-methylphosphonate 5-triphosphate diphosphatase